MPETSDTIAIGELARQLSITTRTIRYYEEIGLMEAPQRQDGGMRRYCRDDITRLKFILKLKELGLSLREMDELAHLYRAHGHPERIMPRLLELLDGHIFRIDDKIGKLSSLRQDIVDYRGRIADYLEDTRKEATR